MELISVEDLIILLKNWFDDLHEILEVGIALIISVFSVLECGY